MSPRPRSDKPTLQEAVSACQRQVGGRHYLDMAIQPVEFIEANRIPFSEGSVIKYVCRHREKGGRADLEKAIHFLQMIIERDYPAETEGDR